MAHDVFVSHSSKDKPTADAVCAMLESQGIRCWVAPRDIMPGMDWGEAIVHAVKGARVMVLVFSASANDSPQIKREVERAVNKGIPVIPLRIEDVAPTASLEYFISTPHWLDAFTPPLENHLKYLAQIIQQILGATRTTDAIGSAATPSLPGQHSTAEIAAQNQPQSAKTKNQRGAPMIGLLAGAVVLMAVLSAGWWFGIERPRRQEAQRLMTRLEDEKRQRADAVEAAKHAEEKRAAEAAAAKAAQEKRDADDAIKAEEERRKEEARREEEIKKQKKLDEEREQREREKAIPPKPIQDDSVVPVVVVPPKPDPVLPTDPPPVVSKKYATAFELAKAAEPYMNALSKEKLVKARSDKTYDEVIPDTWYLVFHDPTTTFQAVEVSFRGGQKLDVKFPPDYFGSFMGIAKPQPFDKSRLNVDSDKALQMAIKDPLLKNVTLKASQMWLELRNGGPVWRIKLWAAKYKNPNAEADLGEIQISADDGKVIKRDLHPERTN